MKEKLIPERLKAVREAQGLSLPEAARRTGIDKTSLWRYEQGEMGASDTAIRILAMYLGTSMDYLTGVTNDPAPAIILVDVKDQQKITRLLSGFQKIEYEQQDLILMIIDAFIKA